MEKYAYIRVSTKEQNIDRQLVALKPYGIPEQNIYCDYQSGKDFDRPAYKKLLGKLKRGDLLIVKSIDRLGRNYNEILVQWQNITKDIGADILVLDMELLDTREKNGSLTGTLIADLVLQVMAYFAQTERESIHQRQAEGIAAAKSKGKHLGRKPEPLPTDFECICTRCDSGEISTRMAAIDLCCENLRVPLRNVLIYILCNLGQKKIPLGTKGRTSILSVESSASCGASFSVSRKKLHDRECCVTLFRQGGYTPLRR